MKHPYTTVIGFEDNPNYEKRTEIIVSRGRRDEGTIYVPVGTPSYDIPPRATSPALDPAAIAAARSQADSIRRDLGGES